MEVILLERVARLGNMGDRVAVKNGFARNFLLPQGKALRATAANRKYFEERRAELESRNSDLRQQAEQHIDHFKDKKFVIIRAAGETGHLYGSVSPRDIAALVTAEGFAVNRNQIKLDHPIKTIGLQPVMISLHPEVEVEIMLNVARTAEEAERQAKGENLTGRERDREAALDDETAFETEIALDDKMTEIAQEEIETETDIAAIEKIAALGKAEQA